MSKQPSVSICIPTYNQGQYLPCAVRGALAQDYENLEIIISDNHSTDETASYLATITDPRVRVIRPERHISGAENFRFCILPSRGEYFNYTCSDDVMLPGFVSTLAPLLDQHPNASFAHCAAHRIDQAGAIAGLERRIGGSSYLNGRHELKRYMRGPCAVGDALLIRRSCFDRIPEHVLWNPDLPFDWNLELYLLHLGDVAYHDEILFQYRDWTTPEREARMTWDIHSRAEMHSTVIAELVSLYPELSIVATRERKRAARQYALAIGRWFGAPEYEELVRQTLRIDGSPAVHMVLWVNQSGITRLIVPVWKKMREWLRQKVKALLYARTEPI